MSFNSKISWEYIATPNIKQFTREYIIEGRSRIKATLLLQSPIVISSYMSNNYMTEC